MMSDTINRIMCMTEEHNTYIQDICKGSHLQIYISEQIDDD